MIKLCTREMKSLSRILTVLLCCAPLHAVYAAPVATTAGSNLTAFNPNNANNNQWANMTNGRYDGDVSAKADFGNCNAVVLRCAQPKCANGGCGNMDVATSIVSGCVKSNKDCAKYGDELVSFMSAQLVASSTAKINEQNMALEQAKIQAEAQAQTAANAQSQQQMAVMQQQMQEMQLQMQQQQEESARQLQEALSQQAAQSQQAINDMKSAATTAAMETEAGISAYQQDAINRGISADILERKKITGQVLTEIENAEVSLKEVKAAMNSAFEYAGCDSRGNNCGGPKRVKKWRELAHGFIDPYNNTIDKVYDALTIAQAVGVELSDIYMMLNDSCNSWGQYMCPKGGSIEYVGLENGNKGTPLSCNAEGLSSAQGSCDPRDVNYQTCLNKARDAWCKPCTLLKVLVDKEEVYEGWVNPTVDDNSDGTVIACASSALDASKFFASRSRRKNGANLVDIDTLEVWINQTEPKYRSRISDNNVEDLMKYCSVGSEYENSTVVMLAELEKSVAGKNISSKVKLCVEDAGTSKEATNIADGDCPYINPVYAICDTHPYNAGKKDMQKVYGDNYAETAKTMCNAQEDANGRKCDKILWVKEKPINPSSYNIHLCVAGYKVEAKNKCVPCTKGEDCDNQHRAEWMSLMSEYNEVKDVVRLKTTVLSQQLFKQYEYLNATLRRLKTQLEKAVLTSNLEAAGAKSEGSSSGLLGGNGSNSQYVNCTGKERDGTLYCLRDNYSALLKKIDARKCSKAEKEQLKKDIGIINTLLSSTNQVSYGDDKSCEDNLGIYNAGLIKLKEEIEEREFKMRGWGNN